MKAFKPRRFQYGLVPDSRNPAKKNKESRATFSGCVAKRLLMLGTGP